MHLKKDEINNNNITCINNINKTNNMYNTSMMDFTINNNNMNKGFEFIPTPSINNTGNNEFNFTSSTNMNNNDNDDPFA